MKASHTHFIVSFVQRHSEQSSQNAYSGLTTSYVNNGGGQRLDVTEEGNVFMMFSPAEHTDSMKRRKERKRRERNERKTNDPKNKSSNNKVHGVTDMETIEEKNTLDHSDVSSVAPTVATPSKSKTSMDDSGRTIVPSNSSPRSVSVLPVVTPTRAMKEQLTQYPLASNLDEEYDYNITPTTPIRNISGSHRGVSSRVIIHESRGQQASTSNAASVWTSRDQDNDSESSNGYNIQQQCNVMRSYCEEMPKDDDDMFYSNWCSFCVLDTNQSMKSTTVKR